MKNKKTILIAISSIAIILASLISYKLLINAKNSSASSNDTSEVIANYQGGTVTLKEAQIELNKLIVQNENLAGLTFDSLSSEQKEAVIKEIVLKEISYKEALKRGLNNQKDYKEALLLVETELLKQQLFTDISKNAKLEENIKKNYDRLVKELEGKKDVKISYLSVKTEKEADYIYKKLLKSPASFAYRAKRHSLDRKSAEKGGDLGFILREQLQPKISYITKSLKKGEISQPIFLDDKWAIIKLEDERDTVIAKFEDVKDALAENISNQELQSFITDSLEKAEINVVVK